MPEDSKKIQTFKSKTSFMQKAGENVDALKQIGREVEVHLDLWIDNCIDSFWALNKKALMKEGVTKEDLKVFKETTFWKSQVTFLTNKHQNKFLRYKLTVDEYLANYLDYEELQEGKVESM